MQSSPLLLEPDPLEIIRAHQAEVWRYLRYLGAQPEAAEDLCQETFLAWLDSKQEEIRSLGHIRLRGWLRGVARNLYLASLRRARRLPVLELESEVGLAAAEEVWLRRAGEDGGELYLAALQHCMARLEDREREALAHRYGENASREGIGKLMGLSDDGVKSLLRRTRARLKHCIQAKVGT